MERVYLGRKSNRHTYRILGKEQHYTHPNGERPDFLSKDPNAMDVDNVQAILENYKNSIQDEEDIVEHEEENHQYLQDIVQQTLDNILTKGQRVMLKQGRCFACNKTGHFSKNCPTKIKFKTIPHNKSYRNEKNRATQKTYKKKEVIETVETDPGFSEEEDPQPTDTDQDFPKRN